MSHIQTLQCPAEALNHGVLIVEADILVRHPLAEYLRECGYRVTEALNAQEAIALLTANDVTIDVVLADAKGEQQPGDRFALASWLRANHPEVEIILTGTVAKAAEKARDLCNQGPAAGQPHDHRHLLEKIRQSLAARERNKTRTAD